MKNKYFAFWRDSSFPYILGGTATEIEKDGMVYIEEFQERFKPVIILPLEQGKEIDKKLEQLTNEYHEAQKKLHNEYIAKIMDVAFFIKLK